MPKGENNRKLTPDQINEIVRRYTTKLPDGTWEGTSTLAREFGVRPLTINRWLCLNGVAIRSAREAHSGGKRCKPITHVPAGEPPLCKCGCAGQAAWNQHKNRWNRYIEGHSPQSLAKASREAPRHPLLEDPAALKEWLRTEYVDKRRTAAEMGAELGEPVGVIFQRMKRFGIPRRDKSESRMGRHTGELNAAWKGGVADWPYSPDWKALARKIRNRDKWTCRDCGERRTRWGAYLHVHHIDGNKLNNDWDNLISLCAQCHCNRHRAGNLGEIEAGAAA